MRSLCDRCRHRSSYSSGSLDAVSSSQGRRVERQTWRQTDRQSAFMESLGLSPHGAAARPPETRKLEQLFPPAVLSVFRNPQSRHVNLFLQNDLRCLWRLDRLSGCCAQAPVGGTSPTSARTSSLTPYKTVLTVVRVSRTQRTGAAKYLAPWEDSQIC